MEGHDENNIQPDSNTVHDVGQSPPAGGQVMDVIAPQSSGYETQTFSEQENSTSTDNDNSQSSNTTGFATDSSLSEPASDTPAPQTESSSDASTDEGTNEQPPAEPHAQPVSEHKPPHHGMPVLAIIIATLLAIVLAGLVVYAYTQNQDGDIDRNDSTKTSQPSEEKTEASPTDVDDTNKEIDGALKNADDAADFPETELSDTSLGL